MSNFHTFGYSGRARCKYHVSIFIYKVFIKINLFEQSPDNKQLIRRTPGAVESSEDTEESVGVELPYEQRVKLQTTNNNTGNAKRWLLDNIESKEFVLRKDVVKQLPAKFTKQFAKQFTKPFTKQFTKQFTEQFNKQCTKQCH